MELVCVLLVNGVGAGYLSSIVDERWIEMISERKRMVLGYCRIK